jgi:hypothetical protein
MATVAVRRPRDERFMLFLVIDAAAAAGSLACSDRQSSNPFESCALTQAQPIGNMASAMHTLSPT